MFCMCAECRPCSELLMHCQNMADPESFQQISEGMMTDSVRGTRLQLSQLSSSRVDVNGVQVDIGLLELPSTYLPFE